MPTPRPSLVIRLTHTGRYQDGRANLSAVLVPDLDVGYEHQDRKVPVYVPPNGHIDINASSRSMLSFEQGGIRKFTNAGVLEARMFYIPESFATAVLPPAGEYPPGSHVWNTSESQAYWSTGTGWVAGGAPTGPASGDLTGTYPSPQVGGLRGMPIQSTGSPSNGEGILYNSFTNQWEFAQILYSGGPPTGPAGGDLSGLYPNPAVTGLQGYPVSPTAPVVGDTLVWDGSAWTPSGTPGGVYRMVPVNSSYVAQPWDVVLGDSHLGGFTVTLPSASLCVGKPIHVKKVSQDHYGIVVAPQVGEQIDGATSLTITAYLNCPTLISDGSDWWII